MYEQLIAEIDALELQISAIPESVLGKSTEKVTYWLTTYLDLMRRLQLLRQGVVTAHLYYPSPEIADNLSQELDPGFPLTLPDRDNWGGNVQLITPEGEEFFLSEPFDQIPLHVYGADGPYDHIVVGPGDFWGTMGSSMIMGEGLPIIVHLFEGVYDYIPGEFESLYCFDATYSRQPDWPNDLFRWIVDPQLGVEIVASVIFEPADWFYTARDLSRGEWVALIGIVPFIPGGAGKTVKRWVAQSLKKIGLESLVRSLSSRLGRESAEEVLERIEEHLPSYLDEIREAAPDAAEEVADDVGQIIQEEVDQAWRVLEEGTEEAVEEGTEAATEQIVEEGLEETAEGVFQRTIPDGIHYEQHSQLPFHMRKHMPDWGLNIANAADRQRFMDIIEDIFQNPEEIRYGAFTSQPECFFFRKGPDLVLTKPDGQFITIRKGGPGSSWFAQATIVSGR